MDRTAVMTVLVLLALAGCASSETTVASARAPAAEVVQTDTTGLTFLVADPPGADRRVRSATTALAAAMRGGRYRLVTDPRERYDAEIIVRVSVEGADITAEHASSLGLVLEQTERVQCTITVVAANEVIGSALTLFAMKDGQVSEADVVPAINALSQSSKLQAFGRHTAEDRLAFERESARAR